MLGSAGSQVGVTVGGSIAAYAPAAGPAAPLVAAVGGIIAAGSAIAGALHIGEGCGPTCVQATQVVNQAEVVLKDNLAAFQAGIIDKATAIDNFNKVWQSVEVSCSAIPGAAGENCIKDRQRGTDRWDWFSYYLDPIANTVVSPTYTSSVNSMVPSFLQDSVYGIPLWAIAAGLVVVGLVGSRH